MSNRKAGVFDSGAEEAGVREADIAPAWTLTLKAEAVGRGVATFITRPDNATPAPVTKRASRATTAGATHFVSIHCNVGGGHGIEGFFRASNAAGKTWAKKILAATRTATGLPEHGDGLKVEDDSQHKSPAVLNFAGNACLIEIGFIDHATDREKMLSRDVRIRLADAVIDALLGKDDGNAALGG